MKDNLMLKGFARIMLFDESGKLKIEETVENLITDQGDLAYATRANSNATTTTVLGATKTLTALTNVTSPVATTSAAHGFTSGDKVIIAGVTPAGYNGTWTIASVPSTTTFTFYVGTALGAGSAFGTAQSIAQAAPQGMKLGTSTTAAAKNGAGGALVTYLSGSNLTFDATFPLVNNLGAGLGVEAQYQVTWPAGTATNAAITEAVIFTDLNANATSTAANTVSRITFTAIDKQAADILIILWKHKFLGS